MLALLLALVLSDARPLSTSIQGVTLYSGSALVRRSAKIEGSGDFLIQGLPACLDPNNVRVSCAGGQVLDVETRARLQPALASERLQALADARKAIEREQQLAQDQAGLWKEELAQLASMLASEESAHVREVASGKSNVDTWTTNEEYLAGEIRETVGRQRENTWKLEEIAARLSEAMHALGEARSRGTVQVYDVRVSVQAAAAATLEVEYLVSNTGWAPAYDLRARKTLDKVELAYRAKVWQRTGEDWNEVALVLSTARPQIGAQGPEPTPQWISMSMPGEASAVASARAPEELSDKDVKFKGLGYSGGNAPASPAPRPFAAVESQGLSVQFQLPKPATIESRDEPTTLLVGDAELEIHAERQCVPALDTTVWLRGKAKNSSPWTMLPGTAQVFFGADYLGPAQLDTVQPGQEFTLHLGADPAFVVKREAIEDQQKGPGFLSSRASEVKSWRVHLENHGALGAAPDGSVEVIVRESIPRPRDERIEVELSQTSQPESELVRWKQDREERGIHTWVLRVPAGEKGLDLVWQRTISFPKGLRILFE
ncbi:MAG: DUF4139 domain-containing protein [Planctomycetes bacterium]|nr:DUF4139 domain-containing protein [Planctomycetota bacterium]